MVKAEVVVVIVAFVVAVPTCAWLNCWIEARRDRCDRDRRERAAADDVEAAV